MSPAGTMMRVYASLKRRIMDGEFAPGVRLDPTRLTGELAASITPIREALHRLTGEGLVESWQNEGFRLAQIGEADLRDMYGWSLLLSGNALDAAAGTMRHEIAGIWTFSSYPEDVTALLQAVASLSPNHELRRAMVSLCERAYPYRSAEAAALEDGGGEIMALRDLYAAGDQARLRTALEAFHHRRLDRVPQMILNLRERDGRGR